VLHTFEPFIPSYQTLEAITFCWDIHISEHLDHVIVWSYFCLTVSLWICLPQHIWFISCVYP
jgi:hypothetical protein